MADSRQITAGSGRDLGDGTICEYCIDVTDVQGGVTSGAASNASP